MRGKEPDPTAKHHDEARRSSQSVVRGLDSVYFLPISFGGPARKVPSEIVTEYQRALSGQPGFGEKTWLSGGCPLFQAQDFYSKQINI